MKKSRFFLLFFAVFVQMIFTACTGSSMNKEKLIDLSESVNDFTVGIKKRCSYEYGISFYSPSGPDEIKKVFGNPTNLSFPAELLVNIESVNGERLVASETLGGKGHGYRYGPNPVKFILGVVPLSVGEYSVTIERILFDKRISSFEARFFMADIPKTKC